MELVEGVVHIGGGERFSDANAFVSELNAVGSEYDVTTQVFDARYVVSRRHLERALELADRERARGDSIVRDRAVEILLYAAGRRQIDQALEMGVDAGKTPIVVLIDAERDGDEDEAADAITDLVTPRATLGNYDEERVRAFFDVGAPEFTATDAGIEALVLERVALLVIER